MRLSTQDRIEFLKAALKTTDKALADWMVGIVDALDALPEGRNDIPCPAYRRAAAAPSLPAPHPNGQGALVDRWST